LNFYTWAKSLSWLQVWVGGHESLAKVLAFIIFFVVAARLIDLCFLLLEKIFKFVAIIPGSKYINNLLGAVLGLLEGSLFLGLIFYVVNYYPLIGNLLGGQLKSSSVVPFLLRVVNIILPFFPQALKFIQSVI
jgi:uncharacterized membrane protein required for colicin V production